MHPSVTNRHVQTEVAKDVKEAVQPTAKPAKKVALRLNKRVQCYLDIAVDGEPIGRIVIHLRPDVNPRTCDNFRALCTAEHGWSYAGCKFHRIVPGFILQTGDVELKHEKKEGKGGVSIYGRSFADEDLHKLSHDRFGVVTMANAGPHTNNSQFMITVDPEGTDWCMHTLFFSFPISLHITLLQISPADFFFFFLFFFSVVDGKHTVFGYVQEDCFEVLNAIEKCAEVFDRDDKSRARILKTATIVDCGQL